MAVQTYRLDFNGGVGQRGLSFTIDSNEIEANFNFNDAQQVFGAKRLINFERQWLEEMMRFHPDHLLAWFLSTKSPGTNSSLRLRGDIIVSGIDGEFNIATNQFRTVSAALSPARMGKLVEITAANTPSVVRGFYKLETRVSGDAATIDGILPVNATGLTFNIREPAEVLIVLESSV